MRRSRLDTLREARDLLAKGFCQGEFARDIFGAALPPGEAFPYTAKQGAAQWCAEGALCAAAGGWDYDLERALAARVDAPWGQLWRWADAENRTQEEVLALFDEAIAELEAARGEVPVAVAV